MFEAGLFQLLQTAPALVALQGANVFPVLLPEGTTVGTTYQIVGGSSAATFTSVGVQRRRVQTDHFAETYLIAVQLRNATIKLLNQFVGELPNGFEVMQCDLIQPIDHFDNDVRQFRCSAEFYFYFNL